MKKWDRYEIEWIDSHGTGVWRDVEEFTEETPPPTINQMYQGRRFLTKDGKAAKEAMAWEIKSQFRGESLSDNVSVNVVFYFKDNRKDIDNCLKALLDSITGLIWKDDRQIRELHVVKEIDKDNPRTEITVL